MSVPWMALPSEDLRLRAVTCVEEGEHPREVAESFGVSERSVWRWLAGWRRHGPAGLSDRPRCGRPPKLSPGQVAAVLRWVQRSPCDFGFATERWTAMRLTRLIEQHWGVRMNGRYLCDWLRRRGITPQMPQRVPRERDQAEIDAWLAREWPRIKKRPGIGRRASCLPTKAGFCSRRCCVARSLRSATHLCCISVRRTVKKFRWRRH